MFFFSFLELRKEISSAEDVHIMMMQTLTTSMNATWTLIRNWLDIMIHLQQKSSKTWKEERLFNKLAQYQSKSPLSYKITLAKNITLRRPFSMKAHFCICIFMFKSCIQLIHISIKWIQGSFLLFCIYIQYLKANNDPSEATVFL